jgi:hypothetical protein
MGIGRVHAPFRYAVQQGLKTVVVRLQKDIGYHLLFILFRVARPFDRDLPAFSIAIATAWSRGRPERTSSAMFFEIVSSEDPLRSGKVSLLKLLLERKYGPGKPFLNGVVGSPSQRV